MGCQVIVNENLEIRYSRGSWLFAAMCRPWFDQIRDTDSDRWYQDSIDITSIHSANMVVPWVFEEYLKWAKENDAIPIDSYGQIDRDDFNTVRKFLKNAANAETSAVLSH